MASLPATYRIELTPAATRALRKLATEVSRRIARKIDALATQPRPADARKLEGEEGLYRVRVGDYRIIYSVHDDVLLVLVVRIGHRSDIYKAMRRR
jgi:mRNA interferase RelE/StbE